MVQFGVPDVEAAMTLGKEAADYISGTFIKVSDVIGFARSKYKLLSNPWGEVEDYMIFEYKL